MTRLPHSSDLLELALRLIWFEPPEQALADPIRFLAYAMTYATADELTVLRRHVSEAAFEEALDNAPPGIFDARSWAYWNAMVGRFDPPPMPSRKFPD